LLQLPSTLCSILKTGTASQRKSLLLQPTVLLSQSSLSQSPPCWGAVKKRTEPWRSKINDRMNTIEATTESAMPWKTVDIIPMPFSRKFSERD